MDISTLDGIPPELFRILAQRAMRRHMPEGAAIFRPGGGSDALLILRSGVLRIERCLPSGTDHGIVRLRGGECCILTAACLMPGGASSIAGTAESDLEILWLLLGGCDDLMATSAGFRGLVFRACARRIADMRGRGAVSATRAEARGICGALRG